MNGIRVGIRDTRQKMKPKWNHTIPTSILPRPRARCDWVASTFSLHPLFPEEIFKKMVKRGILCKVLLNGCLTPFIWPQKCGDVPNFRSRLGGNKILCDKQPINWLPLKSTGVLGFSQVECSSHLKADSVAIRREFLLNFWRFCIHSVVDYQGRGFLLSEDENSVDSGSCELGHFCSGREEGEICCVVVFG